MIEAELIVTRREALALSAAAYAYFQAVLSVSSAESEVSSGSASGVGLEDQQHANDAKVSSQSEDLNGRELLSSGDALSFDAAVLFRGELRNPSFGDGLMSAIQHTATDTPLPRPNRNGIGDGPLETFVRDRGNDLPQGTTVSVGGEFAQRVKTDGLKRMGGPGYTWVWVLPMTDFSNNGVGWSVTIGIGKYGGGFLTYSSGSGNDSWSGGGFVASKSGAAVLAALNLTEASKGDVVFEIGIIAPIPTRPYMYTEGSVEIRPIDEAFEIFRNVLGPLSDYRNFQDPLLNSF